MEIVKALNSYCLTKDGISLTMQFGIAENACGSKERWRFYGANIPMPVRSGTWFHGLSVREMMRWLFANGWTLHSRTNLQSGIIYPVFKGNKETDRLYQDETAFKDAVVYLYNNGRVANAIRLYRLVKQCPLSDAYKAVREIIALDEQPKS